MAAMKHSTHWCNHLGKLAKSQHTSKMTQPQTGNGGRAEKERTWFSGREQDLLEGNE